MRCFDSERTPVKAARGDSRRRFPAKAARSGGKRGLAGGVAVFAARRDSSANAG